jgi:hypothetical protein
MIKKVMAIEDLKQLALTYFKNRDIMLRRIEKIEEVDDSFIIHNNDSTSNHVKILPYFEDVDTIINTFQGKQSTLIVCNSIANVDFVIKNWEKLVRLKELTIIFANPDSLQDRKWILNPYVHDKITEPKALRAGLISLFGTVDPIVKRM